MIGLNDFRRRWDAVGPAIIRAAERVGASGCYILGREVDQFEKALADFWGVNYAVGVGNGMDALEIALRSLDLRRGEKVLTTPFSAFATTLAILRAGGVPVFVDVDDNGNIDLDQSREVLARDRSIRFLVPVHLYGNPLHLEKLAALKVDFELVVVEDCAQAIGAKFNGHGVGTVGQAAGTSFYPTKNLGGFGDAGALLTNHDHVALRARALRNYGQSSLYLHDEYGLNSRLDELQAAVLVDALLPNLVQWTKVRQQLAARYRAEIRNSTIRLLTSGQGAEAVWHIFPLFVNQRDHLRDYLTECQISNGIHYPRIIPEQPALQALGTYEIASEPNNARDLSRTQLSLPIHPFLENAEVERIVACCNAFTGYASGEQSSSNPL